MFKLVANKNEPEMFEFFGKRQHSLRIRIDSELRDDRDIVGHYPFKSTTFVQSMPVTARGLNRGGFKFGSLDPDKQYGEIGPGFSGHFPTYETLPKRKPIIFDPISYETFLPIVEEAIQEMEHSNQEILGTLSRPNWVYEGLCEIRDTCRFYLNPEKVIRYQMTFREAMTKHPTLHNKFDVAPVSSFSADYYDSSPSEMDSKDSHLDLVNLCLKKQ